MKKRSFSNTSSSNLLSNLKTPNERTLESHMQQIISTCNNPYDGSYRVAVSKFQKFLSTTYADLSKYTDDTFFIDTIFVSLSKYNNDPSIYYLFLSLIIDIDIGSKAVKCTRITREFFNYPTENQLGWKYFEKVLVWVSGQLGASMHSILTPLRDKIWQCFPQNTITVSLNILDIFLRRFPSSLNGHFDSLLAFVFYFSKLDYETQINRKLCRSLCRRIIKSFFKLMDTVYEPQISPILTSLTTSLSLVNSQPFSLSTVEIFLNLMEKHPEFARRLHFKEIPISHITDSRALLRTIPLIYRCSPEIFDVTHIRSIFHICGMILKTANSEQRNDILTAIGDLSFLIGQKIVQHEDAFNGILEAIKNVSSDIEFYAFLSIVSPHSETMKKHNRVIFEKPLSSLTALALSHYCAVWPDSSANIHEHVISEINPIIFGEQAPAKKLIFCLNSLMKFNFTSGQLTPTLLYKYSKLMNHENSKVRKKCAKMLSLQQKKSQYTSICLITALSIEESDELRLKLIGRVEAEPSSNFLISHLVPLLYDRQIEVCGAALQLLCKINDAKSSIYNFITHTVQNLKFISYLPRTSIKSLSIIAKVRPSLVQPFAPFLIEKLLNNEAQNSTTLLLLSLLIPISPITVDIDLLEHHIYKNLRMHAMAKKISSALDLLIISFQCTDICDHSDRIFSSLIELSEVVEDETTKAKLLEAIANIGPKSMLGLQRKHGQSEFIIGNSLMSKSVTLSLSIILNIMGDESQQALHAKAIDSLLIILKNYKDVAEQFKGAIIHQTINVLKKGSKSITALISHIVTLTITVFGKGTEPLVPIFIDVICDNWRNMETRTLLHTIEWIAKFLPMFFVEHVHRITTLILDSIHTFSVSIALQAFSTFESFGQNLKLIESLLMVVMLSWIENHLDDTNDAKDFFFILQSIIKYIKVSNYEVEILRTIVLSVKQNSELIDTAREIIFELTVLLRDSFLPYIPILSIEFNLNNDIEYRMILQCITTKKPFPPEISKKYQPDNVPSLKRSATSTNRTDQYYSPTFTCPKMTWNAFDYTHWNEEIVSLFLKKSQSKAISACVPLAERNFTVRSMLFPVSAAMLALKPNPAITDMLKAIFHQQDVPASVVRLFLGVVENLEAFCLDIPIDFQKLKEKALEVGYFPFALRCAEHIFEKTKDKQITEDLIFLNKKVGLIMSANGIIKCVQHQFHGDLAMRLELWEDALKEYEDKLKAQPKNTHFRECKMRCLSELCRYRDLNDMISDKDVLYKGMTTFLLGNNDEFIKSMAKTETNHTIEHVIYNILINDFSKSEEILCQMKKAQISEVFPDLRENYEMMIPSIFNASIYSELKDIIHLKRMKGEPTEGEERRRVINKWNAKCSLANDYPKLNFLRLKIRSLIMTDTEMRPHYLKFLHETAHKGTKQLSDYIISQKLNKNSPEVKFAICEISPNKVELLTNLVQSYDDKESPIFSQFNKTLGKWLVDKGKFDDSLKYLRVAADLLPNDDLVLLYWSKATFETKNYMSALKAAFSGLNLQKKNVLTFALRIISIVFQHGTKDIYMGFTNLCKYADMKVFLFLLPQIVSRLNSDNSILKETVIKLIMRLGKVDLQSIIYSLIVPYKNEQQSSPGIVSQIIESLQINSPTIVGSILKLSQELIRITKTWHEIWYTGIDDASRSYKLEKDSKKAASILFSLYDILESPPETLSELEFVSSFGDKLSIAKIHLSDFINNNYSNDFALDESWKQYVSVFLSLRDFQDNFWDIDLNNVSPILADLKDSNIAIPGNCSPPVFIQSFSTIISIIHSKQRPRNMSITGSDGKTYTFLLKANEDTRLDERVMQLFQFISGLVKEKITTYKVIPLNSNIGMMEFVKNVTTLYEAVKNQRELNNQNLDIELKKSYEIAPGFDEAPIDAKVEAFKAGLRMTAGDDLRTMMVRLAVDSTDWLERRVAYTNSMAATSIAGYILGLGDRHFQNILIKKKSGKLVHIDFGDCFEVAMHRERFPEKVPFRLTRMMVNALEAAKLQGSFRGFAENVMGQLRQNDEQILRLLEVFVYDPLQGALLSGEGIIKRIKEKLAGDDFEGSTNLSIQDQVDRLIKEATDERNIVQMFRGWNPWW